MEVANVGQEGSVVTSPEESVGPQSSHSTLPSLCKMSCGNPSNV